MKDSFKKFFEIESKKPYFIELIKKVNKEKLTHRVFPAEEFRYEALNYFEANETKLIIIGQDPYFLYGQADGLAFSTNSNICPKSLGNMLKELKKDYPEAKTETYSLKSWAKQGVLLINSVLSVNEFYANSHRNFGWETFVHNLIAYIAKENKNVVYGIFGNSAKKIIEGIDIDQNRIIYTSHPSPLGSSSTDHSFKDSKFYLRVNHLLKDHPINFSLRRE